jgi:hypothetical protein
MDMRCGFDRLAERVRAVIGEDPLSGHWFVHKQSGRPLSKSCTAVFQPKPLLSAKLPVTAARGSIEAGRSSGAQVILFTPRITTSNHATTILIFIIVSDGAKFELLRSAGQGRPGIST